MIYDKHELIHLAIPKTGTKCIFNMIYEAPTHLMNIEGFETQGFVIPKFEEGGIQTFDTVQITKADPLYEFYKHGHVSYQRYEKMLEDYTQYKKYKFFTFVRNPYDMMVSKYFFEARNVKDGDLAFLPFSEFCRKILTGESWFILEMVDEKGNGTRQLIPPDELMPTQTQFLKSAEGKIEMDFIGKLENFEENWAVLRTLFPTLPVYDRKYREANISRKRDILSQRAHFAEIYDQKTKDLVYKFFEEDFDTFNYPPDFPLPETPFAYSSLGARFDIT